MSKNTRRKGARPSEMVSATVDGGLSAAATGARLAMGAVAAGGCALLDIGLWATRKIGGSAQTHRAESAADRIPAVGVWHSDGSEPRAGVEALHEALRELNRPLFCVVQDGGLRVATSGRATIGATESGRKELPLLAYVPPLHPEQLGDPAFRRAHGVRYAYVAGEMANGIGSEEIVEAMGKAGMLGFFGAAGLPLPRVEQAIDRVQRALGDRPYGFNLIHSPNEPRLEAGAAELYLRRGVRRVSASAFLDLTLPLVKYRVAGLERGTDGGVVCRNLVLAKVSRVELARKFLSPAPSAVVRKLVEAGEVRAEQGEWAARVPMCDDLTAEADSGGHTDNRPAVTLIPTMIALRDEMQRAHGYVDVPRVGAAGGIATPASAAAAFAMGTAYVLTGSINQACMEAGTSPFVREMLAKAGQADVMMAPAADMFEMGVKVQVLKWGTMFPVRARKLYELYRAYEGLDDLPVDQRTQLERDYFRCSLAEAWRQTRDFFTERDPSQIGRAEADPKHKMALVFRSYLGRSSDWANKGEASRKADYQVWCGPAMGAFNEWTKGTFLEKPENRRVVTVALNLLAGASVQMRAIALRQQGIPIPPEAANYGPVEHGAIGALLAK